MKPVQAAIETKLSSLMPTHIEIVNESDNHSGPPGRESHFKVLVVSSEFVGKARVERQRHVHRLLAAELKGGVHALTMRLLTPAEWETSARGGKFESPVCATKKK